MNNTSVNQEERMLVIKQIRNELKKLSGQMTVARAQLLIELITLSQDLDERINAAEEIGRICNQLNKDRSHRDSVLIGQKISLLLETNIPLRVKNTLLPYKSAMTPLPRPKK